MPRGGLVPVAVGRTAVAVGGLADSGLIVRMTRGRLWIGVLATLLVGIVALNVLALSFSASSSKTAGMAEDLARENAALRSQLATAASDERVQGEAAELGLILPEAGSIRYLEPSADDAAEAARRLRDGELGAAGYVPPVVPETTAPVADATAPVDAAPTDPAAVAPATTEPVATDPAAAPVEPAAAEPVAAPVELAAPPTGGVAP
jgi:hypothetical protein